MVMTGELDTFSAYAARLRCVLDEFTHLFSDQRPGALPDSVHINVLGAVLMLNGILASPSRDQYQFMIDKTLADIAHMSELPDLSQLVAAFHAFSLNLRVDKVTDPVVAYGASAAVSSLDARVCTTCKASFTPQLRTHHLCKPCAVKHIAELKRQKKTRKAAAPAALARCACIFRCNCRW